LALTLERMDIETTTCGDLASARDALRASAYQLCLTDMRLPDGDGLELVEWMQAENLGTPVAVITAHGNVETAVRALKAGAFDFVSKPVDVAGLRKLVASALRLPEDAPADDGAEDAGAPADTGHPGRVRLLGVSPAMRELRRTI